MAPPPQLPGRAAMPIETTPVTQASTTMAEPAPMPSRASSGPTRFGVAFGLGALVLVGGVSFAVGRSSVDETAIAAGGGGGTAALLQGQERGGGTRQRGPVADTGTERAPDGFGGGTTEANGFGGERAPDGFGGGTTQAADGFGGAIVGAAAVLGADQQQLADGFGGDVTPVANGFGGDQVQAEIPDQGAPVGEGRQRGGPGFPGGFGAGTEGVVTGVGDIGITVDSATGESVQFIIDESTAFSAEAITDVSALSSGDLVSIRLPLPTFVDGEAVEQDAGADIATHVTILPPGTELGQGAGNRQSGGGQGERGQRGEDGQRADGSAGRPAGGQGGFGRLVVQGNVEAVGEGALTLTLASGESQTIPFDDATVFVSQIEADQSLLEVGSDVRVQVQRGGFRQGDDAGQQTPGPRVAGTVTILGSTSS
jgi:hypothetical protein